MCVKTSKRAFPQERDLPRCFAFSPPKTLAYQISSRSSSLLFFPLQTQLCKGNAASLQKCHHVDCRPNNYTGHLHQNTVLHVDRLREPPQEVSRAEPGEARLARGDHARQMDEHRIRGGGAQALRRADAGLQGP